MTSICVAHSASELAFHVPGVEPARRIRRNDGPRPYDDVATN